MLYPVTLDPRFNTNPFSTCCNLPFQYGRWELIFSLVIHYLTARQALDMHWAPGSPPSDLSCIFLLVLHCQTSLSTMIDIHLHLSRVTTDFEDAHAQSMLSIHLQCNVPLLSINITAEVDRVVLWWCTLYRLTDRTLAAHQVRTAHKWDDCCIFLLTEGICVLQRTEVHIVSLSLLSTPLRRLVPPPLPPPSDHLPSPGTGRSHSDPLQQHRGWQQRFSLCNYDV